MYISKFANPEFRFKDEIIESLHSKYPESIELGLVDNKIIIYDIHKLLYNLPYFMYEHNILILGNDA